MALAANASALEEAGIHYFRGTGKGPSEWALMFLYSSRRNADALPLGIRRFFDSVAQARAWSEENWALFEAEAKQSDKGYMLISSEHFTHVADKPGFIDRLSANFEDVTLVAYARDPVSIFVSGVDQSIRGGLLFHELRNMDHFRYAMTPFRQYEPLVGRDRIVIRSFDRGNMVGGNIVPDFFHVLSRIAGKRIDFTESGGDSNASLCGAASAWLMLSNNFFSVTASDPAKYRGDFKRRRQVIEKLRDAPALQDMPKLKLEDPVLVDAILDSANDTIAWVNSYLEEGQQPLRMGQTGTQKLTRAEIRQRVFDWLTGYLTTDAMRKIAEALVETR